MESSEDCLKLVFNSIEYELPYVFEKSNKISKEITKVLIFGDHKYVIQSQVSKEIFQQFRQYLIDGTEPDIYFDTIYQIQLLAKEFGIIELIQKIDEKVKKYREFEKYLNRQVITSQDENQTEPTIEQNIRHLYLIFNEQQKQIDEIRNSIKLLQINFQNQIKEQECEFKNMCENILNKNTENINQSNLEKSNEINEKIQAIKNEIENHENQIQEQKSMINDHINQIERLNNNNEAINRRFSVFENKFNESESNINLDLEQIRQYINSTFLTKDIFIVNFINQIFYFIFLI